MIWKLWRALLFVVYCSTVVLPLYHVIVGIRRGLRKRRYDVINGYAPLRTGFKFGVRR